jgi:hypothetical protein
MTVRIYCPKVDGQSRSEDVAWTGEANLNISLERELAEVVV